MYRDPIQAALIEPEPVEWLWRERIPRKMITIVGGRPDQGKGLTMALVAAEISKTLLICPQTKKERYGRVLYSAIEDSQSVMTRPRLEAAGANLNNIDIWEFRLPLMLEDLKFWLETGDYDLLVIDPLASHLSSGVNRHSDSIRTVTDPLTDTLEECGTACVIIEHVLKRIPPNSTPLAAIGGSSSGMIAAARAVYVFGVDPSNSDHRILACAKMNFAEKPREMEFELDTTYVEGHGEVAFLMYQGECKFDPMIFLRAEGKGIGPGRPSGRRADAAEWLANYLYKQGKPVRAKQVYEDAKQLQMTTKTLRNAASDIHIIRNPPDGGPGCTWWLPDELLKMMDKADPASAQARQQMSLSITDKDIAQLLKTKPKKGR
jgi:hypothetical protein